jgi:hypothetical protein
MSKSTTRSRLVRAGLATGAVATVLLASPMPAFAANVAVTLSPTTGPTGAATSITASATGFLTGITNVQARFSTLATCPTTFGTTTATNVAIPATKVDNDTATLASPTTVIAPATYRVCFYGNATAAGTALIGTAPIIGNSAFGPVTPAAPVLSPNAGPTTAGGTITATAPNFLTSVTTPGVTLTTDASCPATYTTTAPNLVATTVTRDNANAVSITMPSGLQSGSLYRVCIYGGTTGTSTLVGSSGNTYNALPSVSLSPGVGPTGGNNTITASATTAFLSGITPGALFTRLQCPATYVADATAFAATTTKISNFKAAFTVPPTVALTGGEATATYRLCLYSGATASDTLISAPGSYTIAPALTVTGVTPSGGPAQGGSRVTVTGSGFPTGAGASITASIGGSPLVDITPINANSFSGTTTAHAPGDNFAVSVTTAAGTKSGGQYDFSYGITVTPNTAPNTAAVYLDVLGAGFSELEADFAAGVPTDSNSADPHVYLVDGDYDNTSNAGGKLVPQIDECTNVVVISDVELICLLDLTDSLTNVTVPVVSATPVPVGTYTVTVVDDGTIGSAAEASIISSGSTFTVAPY